MDREHSEKLLAHVHRKRAYVQNGGCFFLCGDVLMGKIPGVTADRGRLWRMEADNRCEVCLDHAKRARIFSGSPLPWFIAPGEEEENRGGALGFFNQKFTANRQIVCAKLILLL